RSAAATCAMFSLAMGETSTIRGADLPLKAFDFRPETYVESALRNASSPASPANDSLNPNAAKMTSACSCVRCCSVSAKLAGRGRRVEHDLLPILRPGLCGRLRAADFGCGCLRLLVTQDEIHDWLWVLRCDGKMPFPFLDEDRDRSAELLVALLDNPGLVIEP